MAKKLKTYSETSLGFFRPGYSGAVDEGSLGSLGRGQQSFSPGAAKRSEDPAVVAATMAKPGVMLKRPVGSNGAFKEHAELPTNLGDATARPSKAARKSAGRKLKKTSSSRPTRRRSRRPRSPTNGSRSAAIASGPGKRPPGRRARTPAAGRRQGAICVGQGGTGACGQSASHSGRGGRDEKRAQAENARWIKEKQRLDAALQRARR